MDTEPTTRQPYTNHAGVDVSADLFNNGFRAPVGGCFGLTGTYYEGGQFLPSSERPSPKPSFKTGERQPDNRDWLFPFRQARAIAAEAPNAFVIDWLRATYATPQEGLGHWMSTGEKVTPENLAANPGLEVMIRPDFEWESHFAKSIHDNLSLHAQRPTDLSERQLAALAKMYARAHGRVGSKAYSAAYSEFYSRALPTAGAVRQ